LQIYEEGGTKFIVDCREELLFTEKKQREERYAKGGGLSTGATKKE